MERGYVEIVDNSQPTMTDVGNETVIFVASDNPLPTFLLTFLQLSKLVLPAYFRASNQRVLIAWLLLLTIACLTLLLAIYIIYRQNQKYLHQRPSNSLIHYPVQPLFIEPHRLRYARIKQLSSRNKFDHEFFTGQFRTVVKFKSLPDDCDVK